MIAGLSRQAMANRMNYAVREKIEKRAQEQRRSLMYLVAEFLRQQGLFKTCETLTEEAQLSNNYQICDNVDLQIILNEYNDYYYSRFHKWPQICKQVENPVPKGSSNLPKASTQKDNRAKPKHKSYAELEESLQECLGLTVTPLSQKDTISLVPSNDSNPLFDGERVLRPLGDLYPAGSEWKEIAEIITREIVMTNLNVHWDDVHGLEDCKELLKEAVVYPTKYPQSFTSLFTPWKGILLYGPPGTGKTMLAKAVATECDLTFFNITASSLVSKWRGDSEKYVRVLFELANYHTPSIIFIDEIDWIAAGVGACDSDKSEPARRFRAELLSRLDGLMSENDSRVILLAATNAPWNLDSALLRRLENHVQVDVPDDIVRRRILKVYTAGRLHSTNAFSNVVTRTRGYSSADLKRLCKEAWMLQMRPIWKHLEKGQSTDVDECNWIEKANSIEDCTFLLESTDHILCTANHLKGKYEEWKKTLTTLVKPWTGPLLILQNCKGN